MDFQKTIPAIATAFRADAIRYALIGGMAMAARGLQRATLDLDFIIIIDDLDKAHKQLISLGYQRNFHSQNLSHYQSEDSSLGRIDLLHAFRGPTLGMLERAENILMIDNASFPVVHTEDIIGLKVQASANDPTRHENDWNDIRSLVTHSARNRQPLDWELIGEYLEIFDLSSELQTLQTLYGHSQ